jgi:glucose/arabinose dehydrogenase
MSRPSTDPYCWTEYNLSESIGAGRGTVWAWPSFLMTGEVTDAQCQSQYEPPVVAMQGHSAPLGITFYNYTEERPAGCDGIIPFPKSYDKYAFIAFHGSWNRDIPTGYKVVYVPFDSEGNAIGEPVDLLAHESSDAQWEDGFRPVDVDFDPCGRLIVTSDGTDNRGSKVVYIQRILADESPSNQPPSSSPSSSRNVMNRWKKIGLTLVLMCTFSIGY